MDLRSAVITGLGPVSAIGGGDEFWPALLDGRAGFGPITLCDTNGIPVKIAAEIPDFDLRSYVRRGRVLSRYLPRATQLGLASTVLALHDAGLTKEKLSSIRSRVGVCAGTSVGGLGVIVEGSHNWRTRARVMPPDTAFQAFHHATAATVSSLLGTTGPIHTLSSGCNSGIDALGHAARSVSSGEADVVLVIGTDCEVVPELLMALCSSGTLCTVYNDQPERSSRPFDENRAGNVVGEGAATLVVESIDHARRRGARVYAAVAGQQVRATGQRTRNGNRRPDAGPCADVLRLTLEQAGWKSMDVFNANGSSSVIYDELESRALVDVVGDALAETPVHSIKSMLGQHGAGSSALQAVSSCLSLHTGWVPPTINCENPDPACGPLRIRATRERLDPRRILSHSVGFGGLYYSALALESADDELRAGNAPSPPFEPW